MNKRNLLSLAEWVSAITVTASIIGIHIARAFSAGPLWRDETNTINLATLGSIQEIWSELDNDSFPLLWFSLVRGLHALGLNADLGLRAAGLIVGCAIIATAWLLCRKIANSIPWIFLIFIGLSSATITAGDSMRAYGFGIWMILLTVGAIWKAATRDEAKWKWLALLACIVSVHSVYYNAFLVFAICMGGMSICAAQKNWKCARWILAIGILSAISLLPYVPVFQRNVDWSALIRYPELWQGSGLQWFWIKFSETFQSTGTWTAWLWVVMAGGSIAFGIYRIRLHYEPNSADTGDQRLIVYGWISLIVGVLAYYAFLRTIQYYTQPWYYITLIAFGSMMMDIIFATIRSERIRWLRLAGFLSLTGLFLAPCLRASLVRASNIDGVATYLRLHERPGDFIVVNPWYYGISFARYYPGDNQWTSVPPIGDFRFHRYDRMRDQMMAANPLPEVLAGMERALRENHRVWIVGTISMPPPGKPPLQLKPAPHSPYGWKDGPYLESWSQQIGEFIQQSAISGEVIDLSSGHPISPYENLGLIKIEGWRKD